MGFTVTGLALWYYRMLPSVTEGTGKGLVLCHCFFQLLSHLFMAWNTKISWRCQGIVNLQWMMGRVAAKTVTGYLALDMRLMAF
jgi:hypothetical protein